MKMISYKDYRAIQQKKVDELPIFWAFNNSQFKEEMEKRGLKEDEYDKIYRLPMPGGFYLRKDAEIIRAYFNGTDDIEKLMNNKTFAYQAFSYEMDNHEYCINRYQGDYDVISCFFNCDWSDEKTYIEYLTENNRADLIPTYERAKKSHYKRAEKWF